jgi:hypothetical protein
MAGHLDGRVEIGVYDVTFELSSERTKVVLNTLDIACRNLCSQRLFGDW